MARDDLDFNPYAPPKTEVSSGSFYGADLSSSEYVWREGKLLVLRKGAVPPHRCVKCNGEPALPPFHKKLSWHKPIWFILVLLSLWLYIIVYFFVRYKGELDICLCQKHKSRRRFWIIFSWVLAISSLIAIGVGVDQQVPVVSVLGVIGFLVALFAGILGTRLLIPTKMDESIMWLKGACPEYLASLSSTEVKPAPLGNDIIG